MRQGMKNRVAVVTGGSSGIGRASSLAFAQQGAKVELLMCLSKMAKRLREL